MSKNLTRLISFLRKYDLFMDYEVTLETSEFIEVTHKYHNIRTVYDTRVWIALFAELGIDEVNSYFSSSLIHIKFDKT